MRNWIIILGLVIFTQACVGQPGIQTGADQTSEYLHLLEGKKTGLCINHTSLVGDQLLVDSLLALGIEIPKIFTPEHGFRGTADAGEKIESSITEKFEVVSLYGSNKKPSDQQLEGIEVMVFDIQDVGARFYTYISTMHMVMEACAENKIPLVILDRPNPNGSYVDGPVLDTAYQSFVGMHPIPLVHGLTVGELTQMINGEKWLKNGIACDLTIIPVKNWDHSLPYSLPVRPSPNLPNDLSIALYPSLCLFEGTVVSIGRGTSFPFQVIGHPLAQGDYSFTPQSMDGAKYPKLENQTCFGKKFTKEDLVYGLSLSYLIDLHTSLTTKIDGAFFTDYFNLLAGTDQLRVQIESGMSEREIRASWQPALSEYKKMREKYLLYD